MKKFLKVIFLSLFIFLYCGCTIDYNLTITNKKKIIEDAVVLDANETILKYNDSILDFLNIQQTGIEALGYDVAVTVGDLESGLLVKNNYKNFDSYIQSEYFKRLFETANITYRNGLFSFETIGEYHRNNVFAVDLLSHYLYDLDEINVNIKFYNVVELHNADKVDTKNNIYTWVLNKDESRRSIMFKLKDDIRYDVMFKDYLNRNKAGIIVCVIVIVLLVVGIFKLKDVIKKNNAV